MKTPTIHTQRKVVTIALGVFIPMLSLALSTVAGSLLHGEHVNAWTVSLAIAAFGIMGCVLWVSLSHLAEAIQDITKSPKTHSIALAIALDLSLVLGELVLTFAPKSGVYWQTVAIMGSVCVLSMVLNCWAFLRHPAAKQTVETIVEGETSKPQARKPRSKRVAVVLTERNGVATHASN